MVAIATLALTIKRDHGASKQEHDAGIRASQKMADRLDTLVRDISEMQRTLSGIADREDAYGKRLTECTARISDHEKRISRIENRCDERKN
jgi:ferredoxin-thioredoxin reductase catalytic subunit